MDSTKIIKEEINFKNTKVTFKNEIEVDPAIDKSTNGFVKILFELTNFEEEFFDHLKEAYGNPYDYKISKACINIYFAFYDHKSNREFFDEIDYYSRFDKSHVESKIIGVLLKEALIERCKIKKKHSLTNKIIDRYRFTYRGYEYTKALCETINDYMGRVEKKFFKMLKEYKKGNLVTTNFYDYSIKLMTIGIYAAREAAKEINIKNYQKFLFLLMKRPLSDYKNLPTNELKKEINLNERMKEIFPEFNCEEKEEKIETPLEIKNRLIKNIDKQILRLLNEKISRKDIVKHVNTIKNNNPRLMSRTKKQQIELELKKLEDVQQREELRKNLFNSLTNDQLEEYSALSEDEINYLDNLPHCKAYENMIKRKRTLEKRKELAAKGMTQKEILKKEAKIRQDNRKNIRKKYKKKVKPTRTVEEMNEFKAIKRKEREALAKLEQNQEKTD